MKIHVNRYEDWPEGDFAYPCVCGKSIAANHVCDQGEALEYIASTYMENDARSKYCGACLQLLRLEQMRRGL